MFTVIPLPAYEDNYIWVLRTATHAAAVDPGEAAPLLAYLEKEGLALSAILLTHHHWDHTDDLPLVLARHPVPVYGPRRPGLEAVTHPLTGGETVELPDIGARFRVLALPGHTRDHLGYVGHGRLFCGDALFPLGCGKLFEGTPEQAAASLATLRALPDDTLVHSAHEYTLDNLPFALLIEPDNPALLARAEEARTLRAAGRPTLPVPLSVEKATNPFLRCDVPQVAAAARARAGKSLPDPVAVFAILRAWRDAPKP